MIVSTLVAAVSLSAGSLSVSPIKTVVGVRIIAVAPCSTGSRFACSLENRAIRIYNAADRTVVREFTGHPQPAYAVACSPNGKWVCSGDESGRIMLWNVTANKKAWEIRPHTRGVQALDFSADGSKILSTGKDDTVRLIECSNGKVLKNWFGKGANYYGANFCGTGDAWGCGTLGQGVIMFSGGNTKKLSGHTDKSCFDVDFKGNRCISAGRDATAIIWDTKTAKPIQTLKGHQDWIVHSIFTPNGQFAVTSSSDRMVKIWDMKTFKSVATLANQSAVGSPICVTPDGKYLITATIDDYLQISALKPAQGSKS